jgi:molybdopterin converting factor small subunit
MAIAHVDISKENTITVRTKFMGDLRAVVGKYDEMLSLPEGSTVEDLLETLSYKYGEPFVSRVFTTSRKLHHYILIFVNSQNIKDIGGLAAMLRDSEVEIVMLPMFEGG